MELRLSGTDKSTFYRKMMHVGLPVVIQHLISIGLNLVDTLMIGRVGVDELAAVGAANQFYFIFSMACFGFYSGAAVFASQYWGLRDVKNIRKVVGIDISVGFTLAALFNIAGFFFAPQIIGLYSDDPNVVVLGAEYLKIVCFTYIFAGMTFAISYNCRAVQNLKIPTAINAIAIATNTLLNYCLIYGKFGFPELSIRGAAIATLFARVLEFVLMAASIYLQKEHPLRATPTELFSYGREMFVRVLKTATPVVMSETIWSISVAMIYMAYGMLGSAALAVSQVGNVISELFQCVFFGIGNATAVIIGESLGRSERDLAKLQAWESVKITTLFSVIMMIILILVRGPIAVIYNFDAETTALLLSTLFVQAIMMFPKMMSYLYICGILRSGGDTTYCMIVDTIGNVFVQVPLAFIGVLIFKWELYMVIGLLAIVDGIKGVLCHIRYKSGKWINVLTEES